MRVGTGLLSVVVQLFSTGGVGFANASITARDTLRTFHRKLLRLIGVYLLFVSRVYVHHDALSSHKVQDQFFIF